MDTQNPLHIDHQSCIELSIELRGAIASRIAQNASTADLVITRAVGVAVDPQVEETTAIVLMIMNQRTGGTGPRQAVLTSLRAAPHIESIVDMETSSSDPAESTTLARAHRAIDTDPPGATIYATHPSRS